MDNILNLLRQLWQPETLEAVDSLPPAEKEDDSSLADFVRILQAQDQVEKSEQQ
jgi:hypothetical protein